jgi:hypothetical protein
MIPYRVTLTTGEKRVVRALNRYQARNLALRDLAIGEHIERIEDARSRVTSRGVYYWPAYAEAEAWARGNGWPVDYIRGHTLGWAVQAHVGGPYAGPEAGR